MKKRLKTVLLTSFLLLQGCTGLYVDTFCTRYEPFKISCDKEKIKALNKEGLKCSDIISEETIDNHLLNELQFTNYCLSQK